MIVSFCLIILVILILLLRYKFSIPLLIIFIIISFVIGLSVPLIISRLYEVSESKVLIKTLFDPTDILSYMGDFLAFIGTILLGCLALWQNHKMQIESNKKDIIFLNLENEKMRLEYMPSFLAQTARIKDWSVKQKIDSNLTLHEMNKDSTYIYIIKDNNGVWLDQSITPFVPENRTKEVISIINCGNNTAHQVKLIINYNGNSSTCDKAVSIQKDDQIFLFVSYDKNNSKMEKFTLTLRYFDTFQNVYTQEFDFYEFESEIIFKSYSEVNLIKKSNAMNIGIFKN